MSWFSLFMVWFAVVVGAVFASEIPIPFDEKTKVLLGRIGPPSKKVIQEFEQAGMKGIRYHEVTDAERAKIGAALASLPDLHQRILFEHLDRLSFLDGMPGEGTALTAPSGNVGSYSITLRASIIDESLSDFLTAKERRLFSAVKDGPEVTVTAEGQNALPFILLHESTHVVDNSFGIRRGLSHPLIVQIWKGSHDLKEPYSSSLVASTGFRGQSKIPVDHAQSIYDAMEKSPFVSLYSTAAASEDIAELVAWYQEGQYFNAGVVIEISTAQGKTIKRYKPLEFPRVVERYEAVKKLLSMPSSAMAKSD
jgi:hypothetical protein